MVCSIKIKVSFGELKSTVQKAYKERWGFSNPTPSSIADRELKNRTLLYTRVRT